MKEITSREVQPVKKTLFILITMSALISLLFTTGCDYVDETSILEFLMNLLF